MYSLRGNGRRVNFTALSKGESEVGGELILSILRREGEGGGELSHLYSLRGKGRRVVSPILLKGKEVGVFCLYSQKNQENMISSDKIS